MEITHELKTIYMYLVQNGKLSGYRKMGKEKRLHFSRADKRGDILVQDVDRHIKERERLLSNQVKHGIVGKDSISQYQNPPTNG